MVPSLADPPSARQHLLPETRPKMLKADLRKAEMRHWRTDVGAAIQRAVSLRGWSLKEFAAAVDRDERQCARWISGAERPQMDTLFAVESLRKPLIVALAELVGDEVSVETHIRIRRTA